MMLVLRYAVMGARRTGLTRLVLNESYHLEGLIQALSEGAAPRLRELVIVLDEKLKVYQWTEEEERHLLHLGQALAKRMAAGGCCGLTTLQLGGRRIRQCGERVGEEAGSKMGEGLSEVLLSGACQVSHQRVGVRVTEEPHLDLGNRYF